tara:strand:- start:3162 stop:3326 length:165 start_codon:yes stop_codon:yes gene_type:complete
MIIGPNPAIARFCDVNMVNAEPLIVLYPGQKMYKTLKQSISVVYRQRLASYLKY